MRAKYWLIGGFLLFGVLLFGCSDADRASDEVTSQDVKKETTEAVETATSFTRQQMDAFKSEIETRLEEYDRKISDLQAKAESMQGDARAAFDRKLQDLKQKRDAAREKFKELKTSSDSAWGDIKAGMDGALTELQKAYDNAAAEFKG